MNSPSRKDAVEEKEYVALAPASASPRRRGHIKAGQHADPRRIPKGERRLEPPAFQPVVLPVPLPLPLPPTAEVERSQAHPRELEDQEDVEENTDLKRSELEDEVDLEENLK